MPLESRNNQLITVIIVTKNDYQNLLKTYNSFSFSDNIRTTVQLILIDGESRDETVSFIESHSSSFDNIISEPDTGIYDAMNKGISVANSEWTVFMNAGDIFADDTVLDRVFENVDDEIDVLYGDCILEYPGFSLLKKAEPFDELWKGMITTHQSVIIKTSILKENKFNLKYSLGADFDQVYKLYKQGKEFSYFSGAIASIDTTGISNRRMLTAKLEHYQILRSYKNIRLKMHVLYFFNFAYLIVLNLSRLILPKMIYLRIVKFFNRGSLTS